VYPKNVAPGQAGLQECIFGDRFSESLLQQQGIPIMSRQGGL